MTLIVTVSCNDGIVMGADRLITRRSAITNRIIYPTASRRKIIPLNSHGICVSYWGQATINRIRIEQHIKNVIRIVQRSGPFNINTFCSQLYTHLSSLGTPRFRMGLHVTGFHNNRPEIRHIFHETWHTRRYGPQFTLENSNLESYGPNGNHHPKPQREDFFPLFNGDNIMVNGLVNFPALATRGLMSIPFGYLNINDAIKLVELLLGATINMQDFVSIYHRHGRIVGNGIDIFTITPSGNITQVARARKKIRLDLM